MVRHDSARHGRQAERPPELNGGRYHLGMSESQDDGREIDPFVKRVATVRPGDVVIFRFLGLLTPELVDQLTEKFKPKMGEISYVVIDERFDITVLKSAGNGQSVHIA